VARPTFSFHVMLSPEPNWGIGNWYRFVTELRDYQGFAMSVSKFRIAVRVMLGLMLGVVVLYAFAIYELNRSMKRAFGPELQRDLQDFGSALKGTAGEALFEHGTVVPSKANMPAGSNAIEQGKNLVVAYRKDPERFKKYGALLEAALNAFAVGDAVRQIPASVKLPSDSLGVMSLGGDQKIDAWGHPYCLLASANRIAIISLGPKAKMPASCRNFSISKRDIFSAHRKLYERPSGEVILIVDRSSQKRSIEQAMDRP
jgi:hypothetical protein